MFNRFIINNNCVVVHNNQKMWENNNKIVTYSFFPGKFLFTV